MVIASYMYMYMYTNVQTKMTLLIMCISTYGVLLDLETMKSLQVMVSVSATITTPCWIGSSTIECCNKQILHNVWIVNEVQVDEVKISSITKCFYKRGYTYKWVKIHVHVHIHVHELMKVKLTCTRIYVCILGLQWIAVCGIRLLSQKCCHNSFLVKYQIIAHHSAATNCYTCRCL